jgi:hypothetical protein
MVQRATDFQQPGGNLYTGVQMNFFKRHSLTFLGILIGSLAGYAYYFYVGCSSGSCPITARPFNSTAYGALIGAMLFSGIKTTSNQS